MKILLISVSGRLPSDGSRLVSALLKQAGHQVTNIYLARIDPDYDQAELEILDQLLRETQLVLMAVYSNYTGRAARLTSMIHHKYPGMMVIWGGPHCVCMPELSLQHADGVCYSEGDQSVVELVNRIEAGESYDDIPNMAFMVKGKLVKNDVLPPFDDLDSLPYYDFGFDNQFMLDRELIPLTRERVAELLKQYPFYVPTLFFLTSRGCTQLCSYCNNCRYVSMFGQNRIRFYSVDRVIEELKSSLHQLDFVQFIAFADDDFFSRSKKQIDELAHKYKKEIGLPFGIAVSPRTYRKDKLDILLDHGLKAINIGVQSGSQRILNEVFNRKISLEKTKSIIDEVASCKQSHGLNTVLDFIIDNPYESKTDIIGTFDYILEIPPHVSLNLFYLSFLPGTPIYQRAIEDGFTEPFDAKQFRPFSRSSLQYQLNYETLLIQLLRLWRFKPKTWKMPTWTFKILASRLIRAVAGLLPESIIRKASDATRIKKAPWRIYKTRKKTA
jgi:radical SAM superfamily enzyme YgiQ (UPF0313 family)